MSEPVVIEFELIGTPATAGSKRAFPFRRKDGRLGVNVSPDNPAVGHWMQSVAVAARNAYNGPLILGPVGLEVTFYRPRPMGHFGKGKKAGILKASSPAYPLPKPDNTKLRRAIEDGMKGVVYKDDSQIVDGADHKRYGEFFRTTVKLWTIEDGTNGDE